MGWRCLGGVSCWTGVSAGHHIVMPCRDQESSGLIDFKFYYVKGLEMTVTRDE